MGSGKQRSTRSKALLYDGYRLCVLEQNAINLASAVAAADSTIPEGSWGGADNRGRKQALAEQRRQEGGYCCCRRRHYGDRDTVATHNTLRSSGVGRKKGMIVAGDETATAVAKVYGNKYITTPRGGVGGSGNRRHNPLVIPEAHGVGQTIRADNELWRRSAGKRRGTTLRVSAS
ncbi:unnamed protein product [Ectocarpus sp. 12 AP-2014]